MAEFSPQGLSNTAWAYAALVISDAHLLNSIAEASVALMEQFIPQELAMSAWSFAKLACSYLSLFEAIASSAVAAVMEATA